MVPIVQNGKVGELAFWCADDVLINQQTVAIIDIDCAELKGFDEEDQKYLEQFADLIARSSDF